MIIDSSAILAILYREPEHDPFLGVLEAAEICSVSAGTALESAIVIDAHRNAQASADFDEFLRLVGVVIEPVTVEHFRVARQAYRDYGKGSRHPAQLNYGDCFAYALAKVTGEPLLFKGNDFAQTDVTPAVGAG